MRNKSVNLASALDRISALDLRQKINSLKALDLVTATGEQLHARVGRIIHQMPFQPRDVLISGLYRARKNDGASFENAAELWYPPAAFIKRPGRLNDVGQQRFYAASTPMTSIMELKPMVGDVFTILSAVTHSRAIEKMRVSFLGIERCKSWELEHLTSESFYRHSKQFRAAIGEANYKKWLLVDDCLSALLAEPVADDEGHKYKPTIALGNLLFACQFMDAVNYPSVATHDLGINICLSPERADALFTPSEAWMMRVEGVDAHPETGESLYRVRWLRRSSKIATDGTITWLADGIGFDPAEVQRFVRGRLESLSQPPKPLAG